MKMSSEIEVLANEAVSSLGPSKSIEKYSAAYDHFVNWCSSKNVTIYQENVLLAYFNSMAREKKWKSSTLWARFSMIKSQLAIKHEIDISKYLKLRAFLKKSNEGYLAKKSRVFSKEEFERFLSEAPDDSNLGLKVTIIFQVIFILYFDHVVVPDCFIIRSSRCLQM